jgi:competence protein ComEC
MMVSLLAWGRRWRIVAQVLTLVLLWGFAFLVGLPASVVRATTMLTIYGLLSLGYRQNSSINVLAFTAIVILACQPEALFEVGFQMSYLAVFAILLFYPTLYGMISEKWLMEHRVVRWVWGMTTVSLCAQLGVGPLIAFYFHRFSTYFLLTNFIVIPCAYLILVGGFLLLLTSWTMIASALATVVTIMTQSLTAIAALPIASIGNLYPSLLQTVLVYVLIGCLSIIFLKLWQTYSVSYR